MLANCPEASVESFGSSYTIGDEMQGYFVIGGTLSYSFDVGYFVNQCIKIYGEY